MSDHGVSRRHFFFGSLLAGAVPVAGFGSVPSLRALGYKPFYDKLNVAAIGCGGQGGVDLNDAARTENIVALCDVDENRAAQNFKRFDEAAQVQRLPRHARQGRQEHRRLYHRHPRLHARHGGPRLHGARQARLLRKAADPHPVGSAPAARGGRQIQGRHADGQPGLLARVQPRGRRNRLVRRHRRRHRGPCLDHPGHASHRARQRCRPNLPSPEPSPGKTGWAARPSVPSATITCLTTGAASSISAPGRSATGPPIPRVPCRPRCMLGAPTSVECISEDGRGKITYPNRGTVRLDFPARGEMPAVKVFYHDSARSTDPDVYPRPGHGERDDSAAARTISPIRAAPRAALAPAAGRGREPPRCPAAASRECSRGRAPAAPACACSATRRRRPQPGILTGNGSVFIGTKGIMATCEPRRRRLAAARLPLGRLRAARRSC